MATYTNETAVQMPGTAAPTPLVASYVTSLRIQQGQGGAQFAPTCIAYAADGTTVINPPEGWKFGTVQASFNAACLAAIDAHVPLTVTPQDVLIPVLQSIGGYTGV